MNHSFDNDIAKEVGLEAAIIFQNIQFWVSRNMANQENIRDGHAWIYNSRSAWCELMPYMGEKQIRNALEKLIESGFVVRDTFSFGPMNRTYWYRLGERAKQFGPNGQTKVGPNGQTKTDINTDINQTDITPFIPQGEKPKKEKTNGTRGQRFEQYLEQTSAIELAGWAEWTKSEFGWSDEQTRGVYLTFRDHWRGAAGAKGVKADWPATWRNWCRREAQRQPSRGTSSSRLATILANSAASLNEENERKRRGLADGEYPL